MARTLENPLSIVPGLAAKESRPGNLPERRTSARHPFTATAEIAELRSQTRIAGRSSDIGLGGCYIDSISPFSVGTAVRVRLECKSRKFEAMARITYAHASMGMGMAFTEIKAQSLAILQAWVAELSGELVPAPETALEDVEPDVTGLASTRPVLNELINLLVRRKIISDVEGSTLLRQLFH
jgi:PilZ domain